MRSLREAGSMVGPRRARQRAALVIIIQRHWSGDDFLVAAWQEGEDQYTVGEQR